MPLEPTVTVEMTQAERVAYLRRRQGWSQKRLGEEAGGLSQVYVSMLERGERISESGIARLLAALNATD